MLKPVIKDKIGKTPGLKISLTAPGDEQLAKVNQFTKRPFAADELYVGQMRLANNAIDRDNERFSEHTLSGFAKTVVRKTMLLDHERSVRAAVGKFFDVEIEKLSLEQVKTETGIELKLPDGATEVQFVSPWFYIPKEGISKEDMVKIEAGLFDFASIGFKTAPCVPITDGPNRTLYYEYQGDGETREGSLVYLGAQYGAAIKSASEENNNDKGGTDFMEKILAALRALGMKIASEESFIADVKEFVDGLTVKVNELTDKITELTPQAEDGKAYRKSLIDLITKCGTLIGEIPTEADAQKKQVDFITGWPIDQIKSLSEKYEKSAREKFPQQFTFQSADELDRQKKAEAEKLKQQAASGKKDYTDPKNNELFNTVKR